MANKIVASKDSYALYTGNKAEQTAFKRLFDRWSHADVNPNVRLLTSYPQFRKTIMYNTLNACFMVKIADIYIGIETDGYTHS